MSDREKKMEFQHGNQATILHSQLADFNALEVNGILFFTVDSEKEGKQLWKTDGTPQGTVFLRHL